jgi:hypothetical protein
MSKTFSTFNLSYFVLGCNRDRVELERKWNELNVVVITELTEAEWIVIRLSNIHHNWTLRLYYYTGWIDWNDF